MNVFVTDHPLSSDSSDRHTWKASVAVIAVMLFPILLALFWLLSGITTEDTTDYDPPAPFWEVLLCAVFYSLVVSLVAVALYHLISFLWRKIWDGGRSRTALR